MRLLTWNACRGRFSKKVPLIEFLRPDVAVISEISKPDTQNDHCLWFGSNPNQGLAVISSADYRLTRIQEKHGSPRYVIPIQVEGPENFTLFAVWTIQKQKTPYIRAVASAIDMYEDLFGNGPLVMMGDFNSNSIWDSLHPENLNHSSVVQRLAKHGIKSAYHHFKGEEQARETEATFYLHRNSAKPFHIDYCFVPASWAGKIQSMTLGSHEDWLQHSDHMPMVVEILQGA